MWGGRETWRQGRNSKLRKQLEREKIKKQESEKQATKKKRRKREAIK